jgi:hypothetical protein
LAEAVCRVSVREYRLWKAHYEAEWNRPNRTDYYLMRIAQQIAAQKYKNPTLEQQKLEFETVKKMISQDKPTPPPPKKVNWKAQQALWLAAVNGK